MTALEAVTFDHWNTLVFEQRGELRGRRLDAWAGILEETGFGVERQQLEKTFDSAWEAFVQSWDANEQFLATQAAEHIVESLGVQIPDDVQTKLTEAFADAASGVDFHLTDGVEACLIALRDAGVRLGIICDVGFTPSTLLREHLIRRELLPLFDHWSFSDEVGFYKPAAEIFEHALEGLGGVDPSRAAHVGDLRRTDVAGARAMGMVSVRYTGVYDDDSATEPEADHVVADLRDLPATLGV
jgi:putative hydrolase of the HAD superfamily